MFGGGVNRGAVPPVDAEKSALPTGAEKLGGGVKKAADMLAQVKPKPDHGFKRTIDDAAAIVRTEWRAQREHELAEKNRLDNAHQKATMVREIMILPLLNDIIADFAADEKKLLPDWQVQSGGNADAVYGMASTPLVDDGGPSEFIIKAGAAIVEQGVSLSLTVECSCVDAQNSSTGKIRQLFEKTKAATMTKFDELGSQMWFQEHLKECVRLCVLTRMRHLPRPDVASSIPVDTSAQCPIPTAIPAAPA